MKVLASDFDNTLYFKNLEKGFKDSDIQAIRSFQAQGHLFGMCSGRPLAGLLAPLQNIIQPDFFIVSRNVNSQILRLEPLPYSPWAHKSRPRRQPGS